MSDAVKEKIDPTLPFTEIELRGETYKLCFTFRAIAAADASLRRMGVAANMLRQLPNLSFENIPVVLLAGMLSFHPEMTLERVAELLDYDTVWDAARAVEMAFVTAFPMPAKDEGDANGNPPAAVSTT